MTRAESMSRPMTAGEAWAAAFRRPDFLRWALTAEGQELRQAADREATAARRAAAAERRAVTA